MAGEPEDDNSWLWTILILVIVIVCGYMLFSQIDEPESLADLCNDTASQLCESKGMVMMGVYDRLMLRVYVVCRSDLEIAEYRVNTDSCGNYEGD